MFDKDLMREISRINLFAGKNAFLDPDRPLFRYILDVLEKEKEAGRLSADRPLLQMCERIHLFVQSYVHQWVIDNDLTREFLTGICLHDLKEFLSLFLCQDPV